MYYFVYLLPVAVLSLYGLWIFYLAWTHLERAEAEGKLSSTAITLAYPIKTIGLGLDTLINVTLGTLVFLDLPREAFVSTRFTRYLKGPRGWRKRIALWACVHLLDAFDLNGDHCGTKNHDTNSSRN